MHTPNNVRNQKNKENLNLSQEKKSTLNNQQIQNLKSPNTNVQQGKYNQQYIELEKSYDNNQNSAQSQIIFQQQKEIEYLKDEYIFWKIKAEQLAAENDIYKQNNMKIQNQEQNEISNNQILKIKQLNAEINILQTKLQNLTKENEIMHDQLIASQNKTEQILITEYESKLSKQIEVLENQQRQLQNILEENQQLTDKYQQILSENQILRYEKNDLLNNQHHPRIQNTSGSNLEISKLIEQNERDNSIIKGQLEEIKNLNDKLDKLQVDYQESELLHNHQLQAMKNEVIAIRQVAQQQQQSTYSGCCGAIIAEENLLRRELTLAKSDKLQLQKIIVSKNTELAELTKKFVILKSQNDNLLKKDKKYNEEKNMLQERCCNLEMEHKIQLDNSQKQFNDQINKMQQTYMLESKLLQSKIQDLSNEIQIHELEQKKSKVESNEQKQYFQNMIQQLKDDRDKLLYEQRISEQSYRNTINLEKSSMNDIIQKQQIQQSQMNNIIEDLTDKLDKTSQDKLKLQQEAEKLVIENHQQKQFLEMAQIQQIALKQNLDLQNDLHNKSIEYISQSQIQNNHQYLPNKEFENRDKSSNKLQQVDEFQRKLKLENELQHKILNNSTNNINFQDPSFELRKNQFDSENKNKILNSFDKKIDYNELKLQERKILEDKLKQNRDRLLGYQSKNLIDNCDQQYQNINQNNKGRINYHKDN